MIGALALRLAAFEAGFGRFGGVRRGQICTVGDRFRDTVPTAHAPWPTHVEPGSRGGFHDLSDYFLEHPSFVLMLSEPATRSVRSAFPMPGVLARVLSNCFIQLHALVLGLSHASSARSALVS